MSLSFTMESFKVRGGSKMSWKISLDIELENSRLTWNELKVVAKDCDRLLKICAIQYVRAGQ